jgi:hypothetical protein
MAFTGHFEDRILTVVKNTFVELEHGHKAVQDFYEYRGIFKTRARSDSPKRDRSYIDDVDSVEEKPDLCEVLGDTETASGDSSPSEVSSGNDLMSQESFTAEEPEQDQYTQQACPGIQKRTPLRTPLKSKSSPFVPMFQWSCIVAPFLQGCETDETFSHGATDEFAEVAMQNGEATVWGSGGEKKQDLDDASVIGWTSGYAVQPWYSSDASCSSPLSSTSKKYQKTTASEHVLPESEEDYTTVMFRNLPNDYSQKMLLALLDSEGFEGLYDFVYLPFDFKRYAGLGYAFVNMISADAAKKVKTKLQGFRKWNLPSKKILEVCYSKPLQGLAANIERYRNSPVMHSDVPEEFKPALFQKKRRIPFPAPTVSLRPPSAA